MLVAVTFRRRLATANRSHISIRGRPCKIFLTSSLITMQKLIVVVSHTVCTHVRGPKNVGDAWTCPIRTGVADPLETHYSPRVVSYQISSLYITLFGCRWGKILTHYVLPFKVTQGHCNRHASIGCLLIPVSDA